MVEGLQSENSKLRQTVTSLTSRLEEVSAAGTSRVGELSAVMSARMDGLAAKLALLESRSTISAVAPAVPPEKLAEQVWTIMCVHC